ncbi:DNA internalization-related competence protein ComEC/Rec2 [Jiangella sp. DSM 45060]|uniref:DNA internalization-related competence protein ComEC/Rec2 n=1 Tax=Jiangella sp. DSM 45060 TaxID=1798224 RepID=UPI00087B6BC3|nr:DNA internalization-related competence protein ComEC/Rec2 [Jiangella sp. DSM 45060]SDT42136.1 competence protein ComEC [Jiangella sp. DSM 45060]
MNRAPIPRPAAPAPEQATTRPVTPGPAATPTEPGLDATPAEPGLDATPAEPGPAPGTAAADALDLRLVPAALGLWLGALAGVLVPWRTGLAGCVFAVVMVTVVLLGARPRAAHASPDGPGPAGRLKPAGRRALIAATLCLVAGFAVGAARAAPVWDGPVTTFAAAGAHVELDAVVARDPVVRRGGPAGEEAAATEYVVGRLRVDHVVGRGRAHDVSVPVLLVSGDVAWADLLPGQRVSVAGRLEPTDRPRDDVAAVFRPYAGPDERATGPPSVASRATEPFRAGLRQAVSGVPPDPRGLVPGLVIGDESLLSDDLREAMTIAGLTHLTAVSGTNVAIVLVVALGLARWLRVRGYALPVVGVVCVVGFVLLARPEPSVLRAAAMGLVAVVGLTVAGRRRGLPTLAAAVIVLVLLDPWLARSAGFALSVLATAGILLLVPAWTQSLAWLPRPLAVAVAVPLAAQVACTPIVLGLSGQLSLAAVPANLLAAPAVAPATVLGAAAAVVSPVLPPVATGCAWLAALPAWWIAAVARWFADQPGAVVPWPPGTGGVVAGVVLAVTGLIALPVLLRRPLITAAAAAVLAVGLLKAVPTPGWPPPGWLVVACDVGQGDALVLRAGDRSAVVVDTGPEPRLVRRCLDGLGVRQVPVLVLTHFHADHVGGLDGVLTGRDVDRVLVSPLGDPPESADGVRRRLAAAGVPASVPRVGDLIQVGERLRLDVLGPGRLVESSESESNNASIVVEADVDGVSVLLTGDIEPSAQRSLLRSAPGLDADVLKVAHHGSPHQDAGLLAGVDARVALISVGDNTYGHPSPRVLGALRASGVRVYRTDEHGSVAVVRTGDGGLGVVTGGPRAATAPRRSLRRRVRPPGRLRHLADAPGCPVRGAGRVVRTPDDPVRAPGRCRRDVTCCVATWLRYRPTPSSRSRSSSVRRRCWLNAPRALSCGQRAPPMPTPTCRRCPAPS